MDASVLFRLLRRLPLRRHPKPAPAPVEPRPKCPELGYIQAGSTIDAAEREGLTVLEYVERMWDQEGRTDRILQRMATVGAVTPGMERVIEIGPGTGRYLEVLRDGWSPVRYEIYETARDWREWLERTYDVEAHDPDGSTLSRSASESADLVHAHGVFVYVPFLVSYRYFTEMARVLVPGGHAVFDIFSESVLDRATVEDWLASEHRYVHCLPKAYVVDLFEGWEFELVEAFEEPYGEGRSEYLILRKRPWSSGDPGAR